MQQWEEYKRAETVALKRQLENELECVRCPNCNSTWFEQVKALQFKADHNLIVGQEVPVKPGSLPYILMRCLRCNELLEPRILHNARDLAANAYDDLLDTLEGKGDKRKAEETKDAVPSKGQQPIPSAG